MRRHVPFLLSEKADPQTPLPFIRSVTARHAEVEKAGHVNSGRLKTHLGMNSAYFLQEINKIGYWWDWGGGSD